jgi:hypothetical protein
MKSKILILAMLITFANAQKVVRYDLFVRDTIIFSGKDKKAIAVNGQIQCQLLLKVILPRFMS